MHCASNIMGDVSALGYSQYVNIMTACFRLQTVMIKGVLRMVVCNMNHNCFEDKELVCGFLQQLTKPRNHTNIYLTSNFL